MDLTNELDGMQEKVDLTELEQEFVKAALGYSERRGISYAAWREAGVVGHRAEQAGVTRRDVTDAGRRRHAGRLEHARPSVRSEQRVEARSGCGIRPDDVAAWLSTHRRCRRPIHSGCRHSGR